MFAFKISLKCLITLCVIECVVCVFEERSKRAKSSVVSSPFLDLRSVLQFMCALSGNTLISIWRLLISAILRMSLEYLLRFVLNFDHINGLFYENDFKIWKGLNIACPAPDLV